MAAFAKGSASSPEQMPTSYVAVILDITGSMGSQIKGVKDAVRELIPLLAENPGLGIVIITFTEGGRDKKTGKPGCYVSVDKFSDPTAADSFVSLLTLSQPPGDRTVHAYGDDGDENAKAAFHALTELDGDKPTVVFFITDAGYHRTPDISPTAKAEYTHLMERGVQDTDFYVLFDSVLAHFGGNLIVVPIVYGFRQRAGNVVQAYAQVAMTSGSGVVIQPVSSSSQILALTMGTFVTRLLAQLNGQTDLPPGPPENLLAGLTLYDVGEVPRLARDNNVVTPRLSAGDAGELFNSVMTRAFTAFKVAWKRCIDVNKVSLLKQLLFGLTAAKFVLAVTAGSPLSEDLMNRLKESYPAVLEAMPEEQRGQIKATPQVIEALASELEAAAAGHGEKADIVTLETVREILEAALEDEMRIAEGDEVGHDSPSVDPLEAVFAMVHGVLVNIRFPAGPTGKPNFADSWSAMIDKHSFDVISAESAVRLFKEDNGGWTGEAKEVVVGPTDGREYNGFVPLMDKEDPLKTTVMRIFSGLQIMNLIQMTVLTGSPGGFLPNMYPGVVAATLARVIRTSAGGSWAGVEVGAREANDRLASQMVYSLKCIMGAPAKTARLRLFAGMADPSNPLSKFLMVLCKQPRENETQEESFRRMMRLVLNEWVAATVQLHFGKATPENDDKFNAFVQTIVPLETIFGKEALEVNPTERLHPVELAGGMAACDIPAVVGWEIAGLANLSTTLLYKNLRRLVDRCRVVFGCMDMEYELDDIALDYVVYRFRTARYNYIEQPLSTTGEKRKATGEATEGTGAHGERGSHEPIQEMPPTLCLLLKIYKNVLSDELATMRETRRVHVVDTLKARVVTTRAITTESSSMELLGTTYSLGRTDVPSLLEMTGYDDLAFVEQLVLGAWTPEPPQCLRRFSSEIIANVDAAGGGVEGGLSARIRDAISKQERCTRTVGSNRHGHTAALCYPGPMGWTKTYKTVRRANLASTDRKPVRILPQMRRYTTFGTEVLRRLDEGVVNHKGLVVPVAGNGSGGAEGSAEELKKEARRVLYSFNDANRLPFARQCINKFGVKHLLDGL